MKSTNALIKLLIIQLRIRKNLKWIVINCRLLSTEVFSDATEILIEMD